MHNEISLYISDFFSTTVNDRANAPDGVNASPQIFLFVMFNFFSNDRDFRNSINKPIGVCQDVYGIIACQNFFQRVKRSKGVAARAINVKNEFTAITQKVLIRSF